MSLVDMIQGVRSIWNEKSKKIFNLYVYGYGPNLRQKFPANINKMAVVQTKHVPQKLGTFFFQIAAISLIFVENVRRRFEP